MPLRNRFLAKRIEHGSCEVTALERGDEGIVVHETAARHVDQVGTAFHGAQGGGIEHVGRLRCEGKSADDIVGIADLVAPRVAHHHSGHTVWDVGSRPTRARPDLDAEGFQHGRHQRADGTQTEQEHHGVVELGQRWPHLPPPGIGLPDETGK